MENMDMENMEENKKGGVNRGWINGDSWEGGNGGGNNNMRKLKSLFQQINNNWRHGYKPGKLS